MSEPASVDIPHRLGAAEAKRRVQANLGTLTGKLPAGATVSPAWDGDRLRLDIGVLGQQAAAMLDILDDRVRISVQMPPALAFFRQAIEAGLRQSGAALLEDKTKR
jgi:Putative polyhydroxyalkanoic acid system protein (PHA_gran_rgn)